MIDIESLTAIWGAPHFDSYLFRQITNHNKSHLRSVGKKHLRSVAKTHLRSLVTHLRARTRSSWTNRWSAGTVILADQTVHVQTASARSGKDTSAQCWKSTSAQSRNASARIDLRLSRHDSFVVHIFVCFCIAICVRVANYAFDFPKYVVSFMN